MSPYSGLRSTGERFDRLGLPTVVAVRVVTLGVAEREPGAPAGKKRRNRLDLFINES